MINTDKALYTPESAEYYKKIGEANPGLVNGADSGDGASVGGLTPITIRYPTDNPYTKSLKEFASGLPNSSNIPVSEVQALRDSYMASAQKEIDAINEVYISKIRGEEEATKERVGMERAVASRSGLLSGNPIGRAMMEKQVSIGKQRVSDIESELKLKAQEIQNRADERYERAIGIRKDEAWKGSQAKIAALKEIKEESEKDFKTLAGSGKYTVDDLKNTDYWQQYADEIYGGDTEKLTLMFEGNQPKDKQVDWKTQFIKGEGGTSKILMYGLDPIDGQLKTQEFSVNIPLPEDARDYESKILSDGTLIYTPSKMLPNENIEDFKKRVFVWGSPGEFKKEEKPTQFEQVQSEIPEIEKKLLESKNSYIPDPKNPNASILSKGEYANANVYTDLRTKSKMNPSEFDNRFSNMLSPEDKKKLGIVKEGEPSAWEVDASIWQWLSTDGANFSDEEKKQQIMGMGRNPENFGIY